MDDHEDPRRRRRKMKSEDEEEGSESEESVVEDEEPLSEDEDELSDEEEDEVDEEAEEEEEEVEVEESEVPAVTQKLSKAHIQKSTSRVKGRAQPRYKKKGEQEPQQDTEKETDEVKSDAAENEEEEDKLDPNDPQIVPTKGQFYLHDDRNSVSYRGRGRGRGRGGRGRSRHNDVWAPAEPQWTHDGYEELLREEEEQQEKRLLRKAEGRERGRGRGRGRGRSGRGGYNGEGPTYRPKNASTSTPATSVASKPSTSNSTSYSTSTPPPTLTSSTPPPSAPSAGPLKHASTKVMNPFAKEFVGNTRIPIAPSNRVPHEPKPPVLTANAPVFQPRQPSPPPAMPTTPITTSLSVHAPSFSSGASPTAPKPATTSIHLSPLPSSAINHVSPNMSPLAAQPLPSPTNPSMDANFLTSLYQSTPAQQLQYTPAQIQAYLQQTQYGQQLDLSGGEDRGYHPTQIYLPNQHDASLNHPHASPVNAAFSPHHTHPASFPSPASFDQQPQTRTSITSQPNPYYPNPSPYHHQQQEDAFRSFYAQQQTNPYQFSNLSATRHDFYPPGYQPSQTRTT